MAADEWRGNHTHGVFLPARHGANGRCAAGSIQADHKRHDKVTIDLKSSLPVADKLLARNNRGTPC